MYASVAGLRAHMQKLTVIGNNVANVNTQGYKKQRTVFRDSVYSLYSGGSNGTQSVGGMNPSQLGYGSRIGSIDLNMSSAQYNPGNPMDCALVGDGFFLVADKETANVVNPKDYADLSREDLKSFKLTRVGDFTFKADNYLTDSKGNVVYGFMCIGTDDTTGEPIFSDQLVPLRLPRWEKNNDGSYTMHYARDDTTVEYDAAGNITSFTVDGANGGAGGGTGGTGTTTGAKKLVDDRPAFNAAQGATVDLKAEYEFAQLDSISIDAGTGCISGISKADGKQVIVGYIALGSVTNPNGVTHIGDSYYQCREGAGDLNIFMLGGVGAELGKSAASAGHWTNQINGSMLVADPNATPDPNNPNATPQYKEGTAILGGDTEMLVGFLEGPNVDLAEEITELITTQRGYQANTRIITVTDSMLEELVNMKR